MLDELLEALQRIAVLQLVGGRSDDEEFAAVAPFVEQFSAEDAQLYYQIALHGRRDLPICREPRMGFEMTLAADVGVSARRGRGRAPESTGPCRRRDGLLATAARAGREPAAARPASGAGGRARGRNERETGRWRDGVGAGVGGDPADARSARARAAARR